MDSARSVPTSTSTENTTSDIPLHCPWRNNLPFIRLEFSCYVQGARSAQILKPGLFGVLHSLMFVRKALNCDLQHHIHGFKKWPWPSARPLQETLSRGVPRSRPVEQLLFLPVRWQFALGLFAISSGTFFQLVASALLVASFCFLVEGRPPTDPSSRGGSNPAIYFVSLPLFAVLPLASPIARMRCPTDLTRIQLRSFTALPQSDTLSVKWSTLSRRYCLCE